jgi:hypothetical protein
VIPTGAEDAGPLEAPHFDTEAARAARPVVPLAGQSGELGSTPQSVRYRQSAPVRRARVSPWLVGLVIIAAMSAGAAGALALDYYRNHKQEETQAAIQSSNAAVTPDPKDARAEKNPPAENRKVEPSAAPATTDSNSEEHAPNASTAAVQSEKSPEPVARPKSPAPQPEPSAREERKQDEKQPDAREARRERQREATNEEGSDDPNTRERARRQRHPRDIEIRPEDVPPQLKRTTQELHRIREIFEGTRP